MKIKSSVVLAVHHLIKSMGREYKFNQFGPGLHISKIYIYIYTETTHDKLELNVQGENNVIKLISEDINFSPK